MLSKVAARVSDAPTFFPTVMHCVDAFCKYGRLLADALFMRSEVSENQFPLAPPL